MLNKMAFAAVAVMLASTTASGPLDSYEGRPTIDQRNATGYYLWHGGDQWHIRWVAVDHARQFKGSVVAEGGRIRSMKQIDPGVEARTYLPWVKNLTVTVGRIDGVGSHGAPPPERSDDRTNIKNDGPAKIAFDARVGDNVGGFDFSPDDSVTTLRFDLQLDGKPKPAMIRIGKEGQVGTDLPLVVALRQPPA